MQYKSIRIISPQHDSNEGWSEAEILGAMLWLWSKHPAYAGTALDTAISYLLPVIRTRAFSLFIKDGQPYGYINWCWLNPEDEHQYVQKIQPYSYFLDKQEKRHGEQLWLLQVFFPQGVGHDARWIFKKYLFPNQNFKYVYHRSGETARIISIN